MITLSTPRFLRVYSKLNVRFGLFTICLFASLLFVHPVSAQSLQSRPVVRLITSGPEEVKSYAPEANATILKGSPSFDEATEAERRAFEATNKVRVKNGLARLSWDPTLCLMARRHSENMARFGFFSHLTPEGLQLRDRARAVGIQHYKVMGENIAYNQGYDDPGAFAVERWMISSGHRANILSRDFRASAIGSFVAADGTVYLSQVFILR